MNSLPPLPDAEAQCRQLAELIAPSLTGDAMLVGVYSGGVWIVERLARLLSLPDAGSLDVACYRDDFSQRGFSRTVRPSDIDFEVNGRQIILVDDVLYTGRTTRAALNELFDYGRPASVQLAVLADIGGRELPVAADYCVWHPDDLPAGCGLTLSRADDGTLFWKVEKNDESATQ
ncbi:MAG: bifunctional pyr operon transcriptional regulator/uracil phosphoribosyltransferase PyrR [Zoogloeaceae bacterium]|jgi:pyrimidine operon attenuation protein/uracil phosphoribosyltransferase|nr:bifunctional pyr operon transcriptional regulator/uracil phosphoribosyltransferase PyrR [Zoogloeaceae bacterium]